MKYSFLLDYPSAKQPTYIFIRGFSGQVKYYLTEKIHPDHWDRDHQRPAPVKDKKLAESLKALKEKLDRIATHLDEMIRDAKRTGKKLLKNAIEQELDILTGKVAYTDKADFFVCADMIYEEMESGKLLTKQGKKFAKQTLVKYEQSLRVMREHTPKLLVGEITMDTYRGLIEHMNNENLAINTIGTHIKCFKRLLAETYGRGWHKNLIFKDPRFQTPGEETNDIYLSEEEISKLYKKRLLDKGMAICRDWFILDCYTGLRISDIQLLDKNNLAGDTIIIANEKTDIRVEIPIHPIVRAILWKYKGFPPRVSDQEINREIKKACELTGIHQTVLYTITKGGERKDFYYKKYEMVSNHTARRSFITNMRKNGVPDTIAMKLAGIKKPGTLQKYDKLSPEEAAKLAAKHAFFKGK